MTSSSRPWWLLPAGIVCGIFITFIAKNIHPSLLLKTEDANARLNRLETEKLNLKTQLLQIEKDIENVRKSVQLPPQIQSMSQSVKSNSKQPQSPFQASTRSFTSRQDKQKLPLKSNLVAKENIDSCPYDFKVYVYPIPTSIGALKISEEARHNGTLHVCQKCILEQFALEYIMYDFFTQFCGRTTNPEDADFFYLPLVRDAEFRFSLQQGGIRNRAPSASELALLNALEKNDTKLWTSLFNITDFYWHRYNGGDHIIVMPAPVTNLRHETSQRGFFHYMMHLHRPIFLGLEYSKDFVEEYPICSTKKNIVVPYPTTDPDLFNGKLLSYSIERSALLYYAGGMHGDCVEIRKAMKQLMGNSSRFSKPESRSNGLKQMMVIPKIKSIQEEREHGFLAATFCPIPVGDSPSSKRMYDVLNFGCIPVVLSDDLVWAFSDQTGGILNHSLFSLQLPQSVVQFAVDKTLRQYSNRKEQFGRLPFSGFSLYDILKLSKKEDSDYENSIYVNPLVRILRRIPPGDVSFLQQEGRKVAASYRYYKMNRTLTRIPTADHVFPDGEAIQMIARELTERKRQGISLIAEECHRERVREDHRYISRYTCDTDRQDTLLKRRRR
jgi:hypothetical protein